MALLDGIPSNAKEMTNAMELGDKVFELAQPKLNLTPKAQSVLDLMKEGLSLGDVLEITEEERNAMFAQGCKLVQLGDLQKARALLSQLYLFEPLDARVIYMLGVIFQLQGDLATAAKIYVQFLALDATNADGYLRLGECHLAAKENDLALGLLRTAKAECDRGHGTPATRERAAQLLAHLEQAAAKAS